MVNSTLRDVYGLHDMVQYACVIETLRLVGNKTVYCEYSGEWSSHPPRCVDQQNNSLHPLYGVLPVLLTFLMIYTRLAFYVWCKKRKVQNFTRNKQYDAFVCYCYEGQDPDFAEKIIPQEPEEKHRFRLCIHRRDFKAGWDIKWNIMNAIRNSNSAIIIMSQDYINSLWCVEEFEDCYMENMKDPAFKLFVILMQPADSLNVTNEYIQSFFTKKTYLERKDPKLFRKISEYLIWVKQRKIRKPALEESTEDAHDPLLGKKLNENEHKLLEDELKKINNQTEVDEDFGDNDEMLIISRRHRDDETGDQVLSKGNLENTSLDNQKYENLEILVEVHNIDSGWSLSQSHNWRCKWKKANVKYLDIMNPY